MTWIPPDQRAVFRSDLISLGWYPLRYWTRILDGVRAEVQKRTGEDGPTFDRRNVHESIGRAMQTIYRVAFRLLSPTTIVARVSPYFQGVYSHGEYDVLENELGRCVLRFRNLPVEMLPELERSFPLAARWMFDIAGQEVTHHVFRSDVAGCVFSCDLTVGYAPKTRHAWPAPPRPRTVNDAHAAPRSEPEGSNRVAQAASAEGQFRVGEYEIVRPIGEGASSVVYEAVQAGGRRVALKVLRLPPGAGGISAARFVREARAAASVRHPHIVDVLGYGHAAGTAFLALELLAGDTLASLLRETRRLSPERALPLLLPILSAVEALHAAGIVHRDIKPANILLASPDVAKLSDFGVSRPGDDSPTLTRSHDVLGTPAYMAPELVLFAASVADERSDQYSLGVTLYECVTGRRPFVRSSTYETMQAVIRGNVVPPSLAEPSLPPALDEPILRAMRPDPEERFASVSDFAEALRAIDGARERTSTPPPRTSQVVPRAGAVGVARRK
ncbi:MAG TPA: serine/threonine-protein kinase [Polyangiaceae bacterium]|nr:serine/threonine-protein kinase [Polyangiaceae bacterium]